MRIQTLTVPTLLDRWLAGAPLAQTPEAQGFRPAFDVIEHPDRFELVADLPGFAPADVQVEYADGALHLSGKRQLEELGENVRVLRSERAGGSFRHSLGLGDDVDVEAIEASFRDGVLRVKLPKSERSRPREIPVETN